MTARGVQRLGDYFPDLSANGIFRHLTQAPWYTAANAEDLDLDYLYNYSGLKLPSPLVRRLAGETDTLDEAAQVALARILWTKYGSKWSGLWATLTKFAVSPYQQDSYTDVISESGSGTVTYGKQEQESESSTLQKTGSEVETETPDAWKVERSVVGGWADADSTSTTRTGSQKVTDKGTTTASVYGFNSASAVPQTVDGPTDQTNGISQETTYGETGLKDTNAGAVTRTYNDYKDTTVSSGSKEVETSYRNRQDSKTGSRSLSHSGSDRRSDSKDITRTRTGSRESVGQILLDLLDSYKGKDFFDTVYADLDEVLTLRVWL